MNSPRLPSLIHDGKLELSLADAMALTLENNLDVVIQRYVVPIAQTDILRAKSGQAARGFTGALYPSELNAGAIGAGVTNTGGAGGTGNAGGITGGGGAVLIGAAGAFDPVVNSTFSWDRVTSPLNSVVVSGIPTTTSYATAVSESYAQMFRDGTSFSGFFKRASPKHHTAKHLIQSGCDLTLFHRFQSTLAGWVRKTGQHAFHAGRRQQ